MILFFRFVLLFFSSLIGFGGFRNGVLIFVGDVVLFGWLLLLRGREDAGDRAAQPTTSPSTSAASRWSRRCAASHPSHAGTSVSNVARPSRMPSQ